MNISKEKNKEDSKKSQFSFSKVKLDSKKSIKMNQFKNALDTASIDIDEFCRGLILCHGTKTKLKSPIERQLSFDYILAEDKSIQDFTKKCGYSFEASLTIAQRNCYKIKIFDSYEYYPILSINPCTRNRQRFSILLEKNLKMNHLPYGGLLYIRGSFNQMKDCLKLKSIEKDHLRNICCSLENMGYFVIIYAKKELNQNDVEYILKRFDMAKTNLTMDDEDLENIYNNLEQNSTFLTLICFEEKIKTEIKPLVQNLFNYGYKIGAFSADSLNKTLSVIYKAKIIDFNKEVMVLEGDSAEKLLVGIKILLNHINKVIRSNSNLNEGEKFSPQKLKQQINKCKFSFNYILMIQNSSVEIIYKNEYLLKHIIFLCTFADGILGFDLTPKNKAKLLKILQKSIGENRTLLMGNSHYDEKIIDLNHCSIEENASYSKMTSNKGDLIIEDLQSLESLFFHFSKKYNEYIYMILGNLIYMKFAVILTNSLATIYEKFELEYDEFSNFGKYDLLCSIILFIACFFKDKENSTHLNFRKNYAELFKSNINHNFFLALFDGILLFLFLVLMRLKDLSGFCQIILIVFVITSENLFLSLNYNYKKFAKMIVINFLILNVFFFILFCDKKFDDILDHECNKVNSFFIFWRQLIENFPMIFLMICILTLNHYFLFAYYINPIFSKEEKNNFVWRGDEILQVLKRNFNNKESELLVQEIEESIRLLII